MSDSDDFQLSQMKKNQMRRAYLITYSRADLQLFPTRESFGRAIADAFSEGAGKVAVEYFACALENHQDEGKHYHVAVKLSGPKRWLSVKNSLIKKHHIVVHFSESHDNYYSAFKYISKLDTEVFRSDGHPDLTEIGPPRTKNSTKAYRQKRKSAGVNEKPGSSNAKRVARRLSNFDVSQFLVENSLKTATELFAKAQEQKKAGKYDLANFILSRSSKSLSDLICNTWAMEGAVEKVARGSIARIEMVREKAQENCTGVWLQMAVQVLRQNQIHPIVFAEALRELVIKGRGKHRNVMIIGPANCGKTFLLKPLSEIFEVFSNPADNKYAWVEAADAEFIFLNDFRWSKDMIAWKKLLLLLEGQPVHFPTPKNHYSKDICLTKDTPVVAASKSPHEIFHEWQHG